MNSGLTSVSERVLEQKRVGDRRGEEVEAVIALEQAVTEGGIGAIAALVEILLALVPERMLQGLVDDHAAIGTMSPGGGGGGMGPEVGGGASRAAGASWSLEIGSSGTSPDSWSVVCIVGGGSGGGGRSELDGSVYDTGARPRPRNSPGTAALVLLDSAADRA